MYERYYGLTERPFDLTPNPRYLFLSGKHREALSHLRTASRVARALPCSSATPEPEDHAGTRRARTAARPERRQRLLEQSDVDAQRVL